MEESRSDRSIWSPIFCCNVLVSLFGRTADCWAEGVNSCPPLYSEHVLLSFSVSWFHLTARTRTEADSRSSSDSDRNYSTTKEQNDSASRLSVSAWASLTQEKCEGRTHSPPVFSTNALCMWSDHARSCGAPVIPLVPHYAHTLPKTTIFTGLLSFGRFGWRLSGHLTNQVVKHSPKMTNGSQDRARVPLCGLAGLGQADHTPFSLQAGKKHDRHPFKYNTKHPFPTNWELLWSLKSTVSLNWLVDALQKHTFYSIWIKYCKNHYGLMHTGTDSWV